MKTLSLTPSTYGVLVSEKPTTIKTRAVPEATDHSWDVLARAPFLAIKVSYRLTLYDLA